MWGKEPLVQDGPRWSKMVQISQWFSKYFTPKTDSAPRNRNRLPLRVRRWTVLWIMRWPPVKVLLLRTAHVQVGKVGLGVWRGAALDEPCGAWKWQEGQPMATMATPMMQLHIQQVSGHIWPLYLPWISLVTAYGQLNLSLILRKHVAARACSPTTLGFSWARSLTGLKGVREETCPWTPVRLLSLRRKEPALRFSKPWRAKSAKQRRLLFFSICHWFFGILMWTIWVSPNALRLTGCCVRDELLSAIDNCTILQYIV